MDIVTRVKTDIAERRYKAVNVPLGKPAHVDPALRARKFGIPTKSSESIASVLNLSHLSSESEDVHRLYLKSHNAYGVGEKINRKYDHFESSAVFGEATPHDKSGGRVREVMSEDVPNIDNERLERFLDRTKPMVGKVHDPIKDTLNVETGHTYGYVELPDNHDVSYLLHKGSSSVFAQSKAYLKAIVCRTRIKLKKANWCRFEKLCGALNSESMDTFSILPILQHLNFPIDDDSLASILIGCCDEKEKINVSTFLDLIDWRKSADVDDIDVSNVAMEKLNAAREATPTTYQMFDAEINKIQTSDWHRYGAPSVRSDLPPPRVRRVDDTKNYGDEGNAGLLISPSICETFGVYQSDIYQKRPMAEIKQLYSKMGVDVDAQKLDEIWAEISDGSGNASFFDVNHSLRG